MKVIAKISEERFLCEVNREEVEKYKGLYYHKMNNLEVGDEVDLGFGYEQTREIVKAVDLVNGLVDKAAEVTAAIRAGRAIKKKVEKEGKE